MICDNCRENEATIHYTEIVNGIRNEHHLCSECAKKLDISGYGNVSDSEFPFVRLLTGLLAANGQKRNIEDGPIMHVSCPNCKMSFDEFTMVGKFGCADCYKVFGPLIEDNIKRIQGDSNHCGKIYRGKRMNMDETIDTDSSSNSKKNDGLDLLKELSDLNVELQEAIEVEDYEKAAKLRDRIKAIKEENNC